MAEQDRVSTVGAMVEYTQDELWVSTVGAMVEYTQDELWVSTIGIMVEYQILDILYGPEAQMMG